MHGAAITGNVELARELLDLGADMEAGDILECSPLYMAASCGQREVIHLLAKRGASLNHTNKFGGTPLEMLQVLYEPDTVKGVQSVGLYSLTGCVAHLVFLYFFLFFFFATLARSPLDTSHLPPLYSTSLASSTLIQQLALADLDNQKQAAIHRSFFRSSICEVNLLGVIRGFLYESFKTMHWSPLPATTHTSALLPDREEIKSNLCSGDRSGQVYESVKSLRTLLSIQHEPPIPTIVEMGVLPLLVELMDIEINDGEEQIERHICFEASWALTNIVSSSSPFTQAAVAHGASGVSINLMKSPNVEVRDQSIWALGNIAGDGPVLRDFLLSHDNLVPNIDFLWNFALSPSGLRNLMWTLSNLARGKPRPAFDSVLRLLPFIKRIYECEPNDTDILIDLMWCLSYLTDQDDESTVDIILSETGLLPTVVKLLSHSMPTVANPALRTLGNIASCGDNLTDEIILMGTLPVLKDLTSSCVKTLRKEAFWTLSNISAGPLHQVKAFVNAGLGEVVLTAVADHSLPDDVWAEACWCLCNMAVQIEDVEVSSLLASPFSIQRILTRLPCQHNPKIDAIMCAAIFDILTHTTAEIRTELLSCVVYKGRHLRHTVAHNMFVGVLRSLPPNTPEVPKIQILVEMLTPDI